MDKKQLREILEKHNKWLESRGEKGERADLRGADLWGADLRKANLQKSNLQEANLHGANLQEANLQEADLQKADLREADLRIAYLRVADLRGANFQEANLQGADLWVADLREADLWHANLREANLQETDLQGAKLQGTNLKYVKITKNTIRHIPDSIQKTFSDCWYIIGEDEDSDIRIEEDEDSEPRSIEFPLKYQKAGIWVLNYFGTILRKKYAETEAAVKIEQHGLKLTMTVDTPEGKREVLEQALDEYDILAPEPEEYIQSETNNIEILLEQKIRVLKSLLDKELITQDEYNRKKASILEEL